MHSDEVVHALRRSRIRRRVLCVLAARGPLPTGLLAEAVGTTVARVEGALFGDAREFAARGALARLRLVRRGVRGPLRVWCLTEDGARVVAADAVALEARS